MANETLPYVQRDISGPGTGRDYDLTIMELYYGGEARVSNVWKAAASIIWWFSYSRSPI